MNTLMARPSMKDGFVKKRAAEIYMPKIRQWFGDEKFDERDVIEDLSRVLNQHASGYEMASELDRRYSWAVDDALIEVLVECADYFETAIKELTAQWVKCYQIKPEFAVGDTVAMLRVSGQTSIGEVVEIRENEAVYGIHTPDQKETQRWVVKYEDVCAP
jgi:hypothetical protein